MEMQSIFDARLHICPINGEKRVERGAYVLCLSTNQKPAWEYFCPMNILTMKTKVVLPPPGEFPKEDLYLKRRWRRVQHIANEFWSRWRKEYLQNLQCRNKWQKNQRNFQINDVVIIKDVFRCQKLYFDSSKRLYQ